MIKPSTVGVIGSGVMGRGIAALLLNAGLTVLWLDQPAPGNDPSVWARKAADDLKTQKKIVHPDLYNHLTIGNLRDDLSQCSRCDWVIEAIVEDLAIKQTVYQSLWAVLQPTAMVSSNTSTLPRHALVEGMTSDQQRRFSIAHFFNPPSHVTLLEWLPDSSMSDDDNQAWQAFFYHRLGRQVVTVHDTPGFIANRLGCYWMEYALRRIGHFGLTSGDADRALGLGYGFPKTAVFGLYDLIGLDVMDAIRRALLHYLPSDDAFAAWHTADPQLESLLAHGHKGRKSGAGFTRVTGKGTSRTTEIWSMDRENYVPWVASPDFQWAGRPVPELIELDDPAAQFVAECLVYFWYYTLMHATKIAYRAEDIDTAMVYGYGWLEGPFAMMATLGRKASTPASTLLTQLFGHYQLPITTFVKRGLAWLEGFGAKTPSSEKQESHCFKSEEVASIARLVSPSPAILLTLTSKMGCLWPESFRMLREALSLAEIQQCPLLIRGASGQFCAGAALSHFDTLVQSKDENAISQWLSDGQHSLLELQQASVPVIALVEGVALGGGMEIILHSHGMVLNRMAEWGLVETSLGLLPGWGGVAFSIVRACHSPNPSEALARSLELIARGERLSVLEPWEGTQALPTQSTLQKQEMVPLALSMAASLVPHTLGSSLTPLTLPDLGPCYRVAHKLEATLQGPPYEMLPLLVAIFTGHHPLTHPWDRISNGWPDAAARSEGLTLQTLHYYERLVFMQRLQDPGVQKKLQSFTRR